MAHFLFQGATAAEIEAALAECPPHPQRDALAMLLAGTGARSSMRWRREVAATAEQHHAFGDTPAEGIARIAAFFDRAVAHSPEASVALYSLGDQAILAAATEEIVDVAGGARLCCGRSADVLDLGCGFGRVAAALAPRCRSVLGLDVSAGMVAEARQRQGAAARMCGSSRPAGGIWPGSRRMRFDLVLAIDSFPYHRAGGRRGRVAASWRMPRGFCGPRGALCDPEPVVSQRRCGGFGRRDALGRGAWVRGWRSRTPGRSRLGRHGVRAAAVIRVGLVPAVLGRVRRRRRSIGAGRCGCCRGARRGRSIRR